MSKKNTQAKPEEKQPWSLTHEQIRSITNREFIHGTARLLPPVEEIPKAFWAGNIYTRIVEAMYVGESPPAGEVVFNPGFDNDGVSLARMSMAHIRDEHGDYDHRIAGVGYMISKVVHITIIINEG